MAQWPVEWRFMESCSQIDHQTFWARSSAQWVVGFASALSLIGGIPSSFLQSRSSQMLKREHLNVLYDRFDEWMSHPLSRFCEGGKIIQTVFRNFWTKYLEIYKAIWKINNYSGRHVVWKYFEWNHAILYVFTSQKGEQRNFWRESSFSEISGISFRNSKQNFEKAQPQQ